MELQSQAANITLPMFSQMQKLSGPVFVAIAAVLWSTDALVRYPFIQNVDPLFLVFIEHILGVLIFLPICLIKYKSSFTKLTRSQWLSAAFSGAAGSALATLLFTESFLYINPSIAVLIQKTQPIFVVLIAYLFLGERPKKKFYLWGSLAIASVIMLSFPDLQFHLSWDQTDTHFLGLECAAGAALIWAISTVTGKTLLNGNSPIVATFWRFVFGLLTLVLLLCTSHFTLSSIPMTQEAITSLLYLCLFPGIFAILIYYEGLARSPASVVAFIELLYPIAAVILNTAFLETPLSFVQMISGAVLIFAVGMLSF